MIIGIVAVDQNWAIGKNNDLLYKIKLDMQHFRKQTANAIVVCGRKTLESFPNKQPLKGRSTIVLCSKEYDFQDCICVHTFEKLLKLLTILSITTDIYVIGGGQLYQAMLPYYDKVLVTKIAAQDSLATVFFPNLDERSDFVIKDQRTEIDNDSGYTLQFITYEKEK